ncbi:hypothetical protein Bbelb_159230 [Branchiostoma belcheri]|nr:hypothetical protein Bbelb_159230 [Branchiostoma belcheri]
MILKTSDVSKALITFNDTPQANWFRYVEDTWCRLKKRVDADFFDHTNQIDDNIKFTQEPSHDNMLPFLDTKTIVEEDGNLRLEVYRKQTHTDQYLAFDSHHPLEHKLAVIKTLFHHADNIITSDEAKTDEHRHLPDKDSLRIDLTKVPTSKANVYKLKCEEPNCNNTYIGETSRPLKVRYKEHCRPSANGYSSAIFHHLQHNQGHSFKLESTDVLDRETRWWERGVKEAIYERMHNPTLNREGGLHNPARGAVGEGGGQSRLRRAGRQPCPERLNDSTLGAITTGPGKEFHCGMVGLPSGLYRFHAAQFN